MDLHLIERVVKILVVASCYRNQDKRWPDGPLDSYADFTSTSELLLAPFSDGVLVQNVLHENDLIFMRIMNEQVMYIYFCTRTLFGTVTKVNLQLAYIHP